MRGALVGTAAEVDGQGNASVGVVSVSNVWLYELCRQSLCLHHLAVILAIMTLYRSFVTLLAVYAPRHQDTQLISADFAPTCLILNLHIGSIAQKFIGVQDAIDRQ